MQWNSNRHFGASTKLLGLHIAGIQTMMLLSKSSMECFPNVTGNKQGPIIGTVAGITTVFPCNCKTSTLVLGCFLSIKECFQHHRVTKSCHVWSFVSAQFRWDVVLSYCFTNSNSPESCFQVSQARNVRKRDMTRIDSDEVPKTLQPSLTILSTGYSIPSLHFAEKFNPPVLSFGWGIANVTLLRLDTRQAGFLLFLGISGTQEWTKSMQNLTGCGSCMHGLELGLKLSGPTGFQDLFQGSCQHVKTAVQVDECAPSRTHMGIMLVDSALDMRQPLTVQG